MANGKYCCQINASTGLPECSGSSIAIKDPVQCCSGPGVSCGNAGLGGVCYTSSDADQTCESCFSVGVGIMNNIGMRMTFARKRTRQGYQVLMLIAHKSS